MGVAKLTFYHFPETWFRASHQQIRRFQGFRICIVDQNTIVVVFVCQKYNSIVTNANFKAPPLVLRYYTWSNLQVNRSISYARLGLCGYLRMVQRWQSVIKVGFKHGKLIEKYFPFVNVVVVARIVARIPPCTVKHFHSTDSPDRKTHFFGIFQMEPSLEFPGNVGYKNGRQICIKCLRNFPWVNECFYSTFPTTIVDKFPSLGRSFVNFPVSNWPPCVALVVSWKLAVVVVSDRRYIFSSWKKHNQI